MSETVLIALIVAIPPTIASLAALVASLKNRRQDLDSRNKVHQELGNLNNKVNSRMDELIDSVRGRAHAAGREELRQEQRKEE